MSMGATIGRIDPAGIMASVWSTNNRGSRTSEGMLGDVIAAGRIKRPGTYAVCWVNASGMPACRVYTLSWVEGKLEIFNGAAPVTRVNHWPPRLVDKLMK